MLDTAGRRKLGSARFGCETERSKPFVIAPVCAWILPLQLHQRLRLCDFLAGVGPVLSRWSGLLSTRIVREAVPDAIRFALRDREASRSGALEYTTAADRSSTFNESFRQERLGTRGTPGKGHEKAIGLPAEAVGFRCSEMYAFLNFLKGCLLFASSADSHLRVSESGGALLWRLPVGSIHGCAANLHLCGSIRNLGLAR